MTHLRSSCDDVTCVCVTRLINILTVCSSRGGNCSLHGQRIYRPQKLLLCAGCPVHCRLRRRSCGVIALFQNSAVVQSGFFSKTIRNQKTFSGLPAKGSAVGSFSTMCRRGSVAFRFRNPALLRGLLRSKITLSGKIVNFSKKSDSHKK